MIDQKLNSKLEHLRKRITNQLESVGVQKCCLLHRHASLLKRIQVSKCKSCEICSFDESYEKGFQVSGPRTTSVFPITDFSVDYIRYKTGEKIPTFVLIACEASNSMQSLVNDQCFIDVLEKYDKTMCDWLWSKIYSSIRTSQNGVRQGEVNSAQIYYKNLLSSLKKINVNYAALMQYIPDYMIGDNDGLDGYVIKKGSARSVDLKDVDLDKHVIIDLSSKEDEDNLVYKYCKEQRWNWKDYKVYNNVIDYDWSQNRFYKNGALSDIPRTTSLVFPLYSIVDDKKTLVFRGVCVLVVKGVFCSIHCINDNRFKILSENIDMSSKVFQMKRREVIRGRLQRELIKQHNDSDQIVSMLGEKLPDLLGCSRVELVVDDLTNNSYEIRKLKSISSENRRREQVAADRDYIKQCEVVSSYNGVSSIMCIPIKDINHKVIRYAFFYDKLSISNNDIVPFSRHDFHTARTVCNMLATTLQIVKTQERLSDFVKIAQHEFDNSSLIIEESCYKLESAIKNEGHKWAIEDIKSCTASNVNFLLSNKLSNQTLATTTRGSVHIFGEIIIKWLTSNTIRNRDRNIYFTHPSKSKWVSCPRIRMSKEHINYVFFNVIGNAFKYSSEYCNVIVDFEHDESLRVTVSNYGLSWDEGEEASIFLMDERGANSVGVPTGTGLGLYVSKRILDAYGAKIFAHKPKLVHKFNLANFAGLSTRYEANQIGIEPAELADIRKGLDGILERHPDMLIDPARIHSIPQSYCVGKYTRYMITNFPLYELKFEIVFPKSLLEVS